MIGPPPFLFPQYYFYRPSPDLRPASISVATQSSLWDDAYGFQVESFDFELYLSFHILTRNRNVSPNARTRSTNLLLAFSITDAGNRPDRPNLPLLPLCAVDFFCGKKESGGKALCLGGNNLGLCEPIIQHLTRTDETRSPSSPNVIRKAGMTKWAMSTGAQ